MRTRRRTSWTTLGALAAVVTMLSGCGDGQEQVASVAGSDRTVDREDGDQMAGFVSCLVDQGVPALIGADGKVTFAEDAETVIGPDSGSGLMLVIDGADKSDVWASCAARYPDVEPLTVPQGGIAAEMSARDDDARAWAACARSHGFATIADPNAGMITLPADLTVEQATALGSACPLADHRPFGIDPSALPTDVAEPVISALVGEAAAG